jgi:hypothetical protein
MIKMGVQFTRLITEDLIEKEAVISSITRESSSPYRYVC